MVRANAPKHLESSGTSHPVTFKFQTDSFEHGNSCKKPAGGTVARWTVWM
jgi:hypothetical protein